jgi:hypothetical protein
MANVLGDQKKHQALALRRLGWSPRRIEEATAVRRETASACLKVAGPSGLGALGQRYGRQNRLPRLGCPPTLDGQDRVVRQIHRVGGHWTAEEAAMSLAASEQRRGVSRAPCLATKEFRTPWVLQPILNQSASIPLRSRFTLTRRHLPGCVLVRPVLLQWLRRRRHRRDL